MVTEGMGLNLGERGDVILAKLATESGEMILSRVFPMGTGGGVRPVVPRLDKRGGTWRREGESLGFPAVVEGREGCTDLTSTLPPNAS
jgi:hypothetical protein